MVRSVFFLKMKMLGWAARVLVRLQIFSMYKCYKQKK